MKSMRDLIERTQALKMILEREIEAIKNLKPSSLLEKDEIVPAQERKLTGVQEGDVSELWQMWIQKVRKLYEVHDAELENVPQEIREFFREDGVEGLTKPFQGGEGGEAHEA